MVHSPDPNEQRASRGTFLAAAAGAGVVGGGVVVAGLVDRLPSFRHHKVSATHRDHSLSLFADKLDKRPLDGFNQALIDAVAKLPLDRAGEKVHVKRVELSARAVYAPDPGAYDEYTVTLTY